MEISNPIAVLFNWDKYIQRVFDKNKYNDKTRQPTEITETNGNCSDYTLH